MIMASALDKVTNFMLPSLENNDMANLLGIDAVRRARGRGLLDAGLRAIALSGPRPATDNINTGMILSDMVSSGMNTYDNAINKQLGNMQTKMAMDDMLQKKSTFNQLIASDLISPEQKAFALTLGSTQGAEFLADVYMENQKAGNKFIDVVRIGDGKEMRITQNEYINNIDQYSTGSKLALEKKLEKEFSKNFQDLYSEKKNSRINILGEIENNSLEKKIFLQIIDFSWRSHLQYLEQLRQVIGLRQYGQKDPLSEFKKEAFVLFEGLLLKIKNDLIKFLFNLNIIVSNKESKETNKEKIQENNLGKKVGRNEKCPCGSGKKYKQCHGKIIIQGK